ncbi:MAG: hypothetical protein ACOY82_14040 [Pseudomonadota bacterium]
MIANASRAIGLFAAMLVAGCVTFEHAPSATLGCDPALIGPWLPEETENGAPQPPGTVAATESGECRLSAPERDGTIGTQLFRTFDLDGARYLVVEEEAPLSIVDGDGRVVDTWPKSRVALYRYRIEGDRVFVWTTDFDTALGIHADGVVVRTNATRTMPGRERTPPTAAMLSGSRDALAAMLREQGDGLYSGLAPAKATSLRRVDTGVSP